MIIFKKNIFLKIWVISSLYIQISLAEKPMHLLSPLISYTLCPKCGECTGLLLDHHNILTAAHCKEEIMKLKIHLKGLKISSKNILKSEKFYLIKHGNFSLFPHPQYNSKNWQNDLMIIRLNKRGAKFTNPLLLPLATSNNLQEHFGLRDLEMKKER